MTPYWHDPFLTVYEGDCREVMAQMEPESVHTVVTSPPYWGLRDYGTATWIGGDDGCDHKETVARHDGGRVGVDGFNGSARADSDKGAMYRSPCRKCGATRQDSQLGLEPTPEEYVQNMVAVFREVRRVLRKDGTCWVNLGDSYNANVGKGFNANARVGAVDTTRKWGKPKDLVGIPWRVAFALQADGWYLRSDVIWSKPNPMPESVTDRPTKAHEYLFLLSRSPRYYYDADAVRETSTGRTDVGRMSFRADIGAGGVWRDEERTGDVSARNLRSVWSIATQPYPGAHFATFPEKLVEPCVKAGTSERGVCPECGAPWVREVDTVKEPLQRVYNGAIKTEPMTPNGVRWGGSGVPSRLATTTTGWHPSCSHDAQPVPATVLDPFAGSGTTGRVAQRLGCRAVLIDLSGEYLTQAMRRNQDIPLGLETA